MKKIISIVLSIILTVTLFMPVFASASAPVKARLYNYYGNNMLFKQNDEAIFAGIADSGNKIEIELHDSKGNIIKTSESTANSDNTFKISFIAPKGSFEEYNVILKDNGSEFAKLENVVFGELWVACGQSNMSYPLGQSKSGIESIEKGEKFNKWVRALMIPFYPQNGNDNDLIPADPQTEFHNASWINGEENAIIGASAVAYYFAEELINELQMPVGFLNTSLGGSCLASWLSRDAIEGNNRIKQDFIDSNDYIKYDKWKEDKQNIYSDMTANFNTKIAPLSNFRVSGMIWYQGESDINESWTSERFTRTFKLLQETYTNHFNYTDGLLPVVCTQIAPFLYYSYTALAERNADFAALHNDRPDSIAITSIHDVPLTYTPIVGAIHPESKLEVGERMAFAAMGLVYGKRDVYSVATVESSEIKESSIYIKLKNTGDGLSVKGDILKCFTLCGENGIYLPAEAEIVSNDTVRVYCDMISNPKSAAYAYCATNFEANLYATENGELALPVSPFVTNKSFNKHHWTERFWDDCEGKEIWHSVGQETSGYYPSWSSENSEINFTAEDCYSGNNGMNIKSTFNEFSVEPVMTYTESDGKTQRIPDNDHDYRDYGTMSFYIRNNSSEDVVLKNISIYRDFGYMYMPSIEGTSQISAVIPADGGWHKITVDLNKLYINGNRFGIALTNDKLERTTGIVFNFEAEGESDLSIDHIRFTAEEGNEKASFDVDYKSAETILEKISAFFTLILGFIAEIFI